MNVEYYLLDRFGHALRQSDARLLCVEQRLDNVQRCGECRCGTAGQGASNHVRGRIVFVLTIQLHQSDNNTDGE